MMRLRHPFVHFGARRPPLRPIGVLAAAGIFLLTSGSARAQAVRAPELGGLLNSLNLAWVLIAGFLVMFMQAGFAMLETGFTRAKNAVNTMAMNFIIYPIGLVGFWLTGYALMMGGVSQWPSLGTSGIPSRELSISIGGHPFGLIGAHKFVLLSVSHDPGSLAMFLFAAVFMDTAA